jgi:hypothetical protein
MVALSQLPVGNGLHLSWVPQSIENACVRSDGAGHRRAMTRLDTPACAAVIFITHRSIPTVE